MIPVEVIVTLPIDGRFHYLAPEGIAVGERVIVPFGRRKATGFVVAIGGEPPAGVTPKPILERPDTTPLLTPDLIALVSFAAEYYLAPAGEILKIALPPGLTAASTARYKATAAGKKALDFPGLVGDPKTFEALEMIGTKKRKIAEIPKAAVERLIALGFVVREDLIDARDAVETIEVAERTAIPVVIAALGRAHTQKKILEMLADGPLPVDAIAAVVGRPAARRTLDILVRDNWVKLDRRPRGHGPFVAPTEVATFVLTPGQSAALDALAASTDGRFLLRGVTGSGKTEVYLRAIDRLRGEGRGAIVLVPEIALTAQLEARFRARFGDDVVVLHSAMTDTERRRGWQRLRAGEAHIALGPRSAVWAPVENLGIVVVDEEHDPSFKQSSDVRYHGRDLALFRAHRAQAVCLLGSATPSLETRYAVDTGRVTELRLPDRATGSAMPSIQIIDLAKSRTKGEKGEIPILTRPLVDALISTVSRGEQAIIFLNRRGFNTVVVCEACQTARTCPHCTVSLTHHKAEAQMVCHYCGHQEPFARRCIACDGDVMKPFGAGTERVAEAVKEVVADAKILRLDRDVTAKAGALDETLATFRARRADVLVGTQMVTKGLDFPFVTLVGIVCADTSLAFPDFRAAERTFQIVTQVAGRAGRAALPGRVIVQTFQPEHYALLSALHHDDEGFFQREIEGRRELGYPPIGRLGLVRIEGKNEDEVARVSAEIGSLSRGLDAHIRGPTPAPIAKIKDRHRWMMLVVAPTPAKLVGAMRSIKHRLPAVPRGVAVIFDVDAVDLA